MAGLSEEVSEFREIFDLVDKDKGGSISLEELGDLLMDTLGINCTALEVRQISAAVDADKDGSIDFDEFVNAMAFEGREKGAETLLEGSLRRYGLGGLALALHRSSARSKLAPTPPPPHPRPLPHHPPHRFKKESSNA